MKDKLIKILSETSCYSERDVSTLFHRFLDNKFPSNVELLECAVKTQIQMNFSRANPSTLLDVLPLINNNKG